MQPAVGPGTFLVASPILRDPNFARTVVLLCEHDDEEGSMGLVINRPTEVTLDHAVEGVAAYPEQHLWYGGPVQRDVVLVLHRELGIEGARAVCDGMSLGGEPERILELLRGPRSKYVRVFTGYSGWGAGQLRDELESGSWIVSPAAGRVIFETGADAIWSTVLNSLGPRYAYLTDLPSDPRVN